MGKYAIAHANNHTEDFRSIQCSPLLENTTEFFRSVSSRGFKPAGLAFLADVALMPGKQVSLLLQSQEKEEELRLLGKVVYAVATGIAGYSWRIGIQFLQFAERRGCNSPKALEALAQFDSK